MIVKKFTTSILLVLTLALPLETSAQVGELTNITSLIKTGSQVIDKIPTVPTNDLKQNAKETGMSVFGVTIPISWNQLALNLSKIVVNQVVDSTVNWMQSGFEGNPAYVTDPGSYFGNIANGVVGDELNRISKGALCSPFQAKVTIALRRAYTGAPYSPQCTLTGVVKNFEGFMDKFSEGDWNQWFAVTQNASNNPYGAFANAQLTINNKVEAQINSAEKELTWGNGFKSQKICKKKNMTATEIQKWYDAHPEEEGYPPGYNAKVGPGGCIEYGDVQTPGAVIKSHLDETLPANNFIRQITNADQFDKLLTALGQGLLQRFVFKQGGLLGKASSSGNSGSGSGSDGGGSVPEARVACSASQERGTAGEDKITWSITAGSDGTYLSSYTWSDSYSAADGSVNGKTGFSVSTTYNTPGIKTASVIASTTRLDDLGQPIGASQTQTFTCSNNVKISQYHPLQISCVADTSRIVMPSGTNISAPVTWKAVVSGGSGTFQYIKWDGDQQVPPELSGKTNTIFPYELSQAQSNLPKLNWCYTNVAHTGSTCDNFAKDGVKSGVTIQSLIKDATSQATNPVFNLGLSRVYFKDKKSNLGEVKASVTVWDADPLLEPIQNFECPAVPVLDY